MATPHLDSILKLMSHDFGAPIGKAAAPSSQMKALEARAATLTDIEKSMLACGERKEQLAVCRDKNAWDLHAYLDTCFEEFGG